MDTTAQPKHFLPGTGRTFALGRITLTFKTTAEDNAGAYTLCESIEPPDSGAALHRHPSYDETFIICEGHYEFQLGDKLLRLAAGDTVFVPKGMPHSFKSVGPETGRQWSISSPGGIFDAFIAEVAASMVDSGSPSKAGAATEFRAIAAKYGTEFLS
jgi:mannose-6-phosphate isomerase-like protein (cupin superfamily)